MQPHTTKKKVTTLLPTKNKNKNKIEYMYVHMYAWTTNCILNQLWTITLMWTIFSHWKRLAIANKQAQQKAKFKTKRKTLKSLQEKLWRTQRLRRFSCNIFLIFLFCLTCTLLAQLASWLVANRRTTEKKPGCWC